MTSIRTKANISTILIVSFCLPAYYKTKLVIEGQVAWRDLFDFMGLLELIFAFLLATLLVGFHRAYQHFIVKQQPPSLINFIIPWLSGVLLAFLFTRFYFTTVLGFTIQPAFEFDIAILSLALPLMLSGIADRIFLQHQTQALALQVEKQKSAAIAARFEVLKMRLSPHFLFNSLNTLADIIEEDPDLALRFVEHMATTYRYILEHRDKSLVPLNAELNSIEALLFILKVRYNSALNIDLQLSADLSNDESIIPLALQELIENALKHNRYSAEKPLKIDIYRSGNAITVENNIQKRLSATSNQSGLENLQARITHALLQPMTIEETEHMFKVTIPLQVSHQV